MAKKLSNVETYLGILFIFALLVAGIIQLGNETLSNPKADLDNDSLEYIAKLQGINISEYEQNKEDLENPILVTGNESAGNPKDYGLDYLLAKEKGFDIELIIKRIFNIPSFVLVDLLRFPANQWKWIIDIIGWILGILVVIALVNFARNR